MNTPHITVLMPVRDGARWLPAAVDSVLDQSCRELELVVVDDGSTDDTAAILAAYSSREARVRVLRSEASGLVAALNRGLEAARAPLVARLDADDVTLPQRLARQAALMREDPRLELLGAWAEIIDAEGRPSGRMRRPIEPEALRHTLRVENPFIHSTVMFRTETVRRLGGYRAAFTAAEDYDLWLRIAEVGDVANLGECLIRYRRHAGGVTRREAPRQAFSVRLARRAALMRVSSGSDPAAALAAPPDLFADEADSAFYAEDAAVCRFLALSDPAMISPGQLARVDPAVVARALPALTRGERRMAQAAAANLLAAKGLALPASRGELARLIFRLHPGRALQMAPRLLRAAFPTLRDQQLQ